MVSRARFERLVLRAVAGLPPRFRERLDNVDVIVERRPGREHRRAAGLSPGDTLLGLYLGTPLPDRGGGYHLALPDRIFIFQEPIEAICADSREVVRQVRRTVMHELAHHFGISDDRLREIGME